MTPRQEQALRELASLAEAVELGTPGPWRTDWGNSTAGKDLVEDSRRLGMFNTIHPSDASWIVRVKNDLRRIARDLASSPAVRGEICPNPDCGYMYTPPLCTKCGHHTGKTYPRPSPTEGDLPAPAVKRVRPPMEPLKVTDDRGPWEKYRDGDGPKPDCAEPKVLGVLGSTKVLGCPWFPCDGIVHDGVCGKCGKKVVE